MPFDFLPTDPKPEEPLEHSWEPNVDIIQFGDGYIQRNVQGINAEVSTFTMSYNNLTQTERDTIYNFIKSKKGAIPFKYQFLGEPEPRKFISIGSMRETKKNGMIFNITFEMQEVFDIET